MFCMEVLIVPHVWHHSSHEWQLQPFTLSKSFFSTAAVIPPPSHVQIKLVAMISLMERPLRKWHASVLAPTLSIQCCSVNFPLSRFLPHYYPSLLSLSPPLSTHNFNVTALLQHHSLTLLLPPSFPLSFFPCGGKNTAFPLTKTLLLSGNYRRRLITTLGSNDAALNEIFIKDPSASN